MRRWSFWKAGEEPDDPAGSSASEPVEEEGSPLAVTGERLARSARTLFARVSEALARTDEDHGESGLVSESEPVRERPGGGHARGDRDDVQNPRAGRRSAAEDEPDPDRAWRDRSEAEPLRGRRNSRWDEEDAESDWEGTRAPAQSGTRPDRGAFVVEADDTAAGAEPVLSAEDLALASQLQEILGNAGPDAVSERLLPEERIAIRADAYVLPPSLRYHPEGGGSAAGRGMSAAARRSGRVPPQPGRNRRIRRAR